MGAAPSNPDDTRANKERSKEVDKELNQSNQQQMQINKLLLLGAGESGKSTLFKQMITLYGKGYSEQQRCQYLPGIESGIVSSMRMLCKQAQNYGAVLPANAAAANYFLNEIKSDEQRMDANVANFISVLWKDPAIRAAYDNRSKFQLSDSCNYFFEKVIEIVKPGYIPTMNDLLRVRIRTTGIVENDFEIELTKFKMLDVGGQRTERKKWIHCFENVTAILFVAALSEYDQMLFEDESTNRMVEAIALFDEVVNSKWFKSSSMVLFLNKRDLFQEKLKTVPITVCFPTYSGKNTYDECTVFIKTIFESKNKDPNHLIYTHVTCATDPDNVSRVFSSVKDTIIRGALKNSGLLEI